MPWTEEALGNVKVFYFGRGKGIGHYMFRPGMVNDWDFLHSNPWGLKIDGGLCPKLGGVAIHHKDGWTAIAFTDYSVDTRPGSNSVFLAEGEFTKEEMIQLAKLHFPDIYRRVHSFPYSCYHVRGGLLEES